MSKPNLGLLMGAMLGGLGSGGTSYTPRPGSYPRCRYRPTPQRNKNQEFAKKKTRRAIAKKSKQQNRRNN